MTLAYKIYLTKKYAVEAQLSSNDLPAHAETYLGTLETDAEDLATLLDFCQMSVDATLTQLAKPTPDRNLN